MKYRVLIIGGGCAGLKLIRQLHKNFKVTLVDPKEYFEYSINVFDNMTDPESAQIFLYTDLQTQYKFEVIQGRVVELSEIDATIKALDENIVIYFDFCVICSGSNYYSPIKPNLQYENLLLERKDTMQMIREQISICDEVVVIGSGSIGVELASQIITQFQDKKVRIVTRSSRLLIDQPPLAGQIAQQFLMQRGVTIEFGIEDYKSSQSSLCFQCTGEQYMPDFLKQNFQHYIKSDGKIRVNEFLQMKGNIFAAGDCTNQKSENTILDAQEHVRIISYNIRAQIGGFRMQKYNWISQMSIISCGNQFGIMVYNSIVL